MEITAQISALEEEIKILKGEIKSILTEIRTSVLTRDNPFAPDAGVPVFRPVELPIPGSQTAAEGEREAEVGSSAAASEQTPASERAEPTPPAAQAEPVAYQPAGERTPMAVPQPPPAPAEPHTANPGGSRRVERAPEPDPHEEAAGAPWSVHTIAGLVAWADETASRLGPTHLHMVLELARFAGLIQQDAEEPLLKIIKLASSRKEGAAASVNDCLVALRQLEAIFAGSFADELALRRHRRGA